MKSEKCKNCIFYTAYYVQFSDGFARRANGFCRKHNKPQTQSEICEEFKSNEQIEKMREKRRLQTLDRALAALIEISLILKEKESEK